MDWKFIDGYEGLYEVSDQGQVRRSGRLLKLQMGTNGYIEVCLSLKGEVKRFRVHRLVAKAFICNKNKKPCVNHVDLNKKNNNVANLEWVTISENHKHAYRNGVMRPPKPYLGKFGRHHNRSKGFSVKMRDGSIRNFESGLAFTRITGLDNTSISWARKNKELPYEFSRGKLKGLSLMPHFELER